ncbi:hypothetical protein OCU04_011096 [Sclerotinia nivalis]|uniref:Uncharacterized protein n=1 Tax=Sclerotinia nivalis TaxID=352851 RepID=A0A9X0DFP3_9HELO|nr:hypothetical protein OCU04_011096 [Sclerotinia nivalis]
MIDERINGTRLTEHISGHAQDNAGFRAVHQGTTTTKSGNSDEKPDQAHVEDWGPSVVLLESFGYDRKFYTIIWMFCSQL